MDFLLKENLFMTTSSSQFLIIFDILLAFHKYIIFHSAWNKIFNFIIFRFFIYFICIFFVLQIFLVINNFCINIYFGILEIFTTSNFIFPYKCGV